jgi:hypothetical protein
MDGLMAFSERRQDYAIVACGTLNMELNHLKDNGILDARKILYTD